MNLDDGSALTAFRLRKQDGTALWDGGSFRSPEEGLHTFSNGDVVFSPQRRWTSPLSQATYRARCNQAPAALGLWLHSWICKAQRNLSSGPGD